MAFAACPVDRSRSAMFCTIRAGQRLITCLAHKSTLQLGLPCLLVWVLSRLVVEPSHDATSGWSQFARELATMDDVVTRLLVEHVPDDTGRRCTGCTTPGSGTPNLRWPCALW